MNRFDAPTTSFADMIFMTRPNSTMPAVQENMDPSSYGVWLLASRINHSCVGNCRRSFIGDMLIVRATRDLGAGTELLFNYTQPSLGESYEKIQQGLRPWGFRCSCELCEMERTTTPEAKRQRAKLCKKLQDLEKILRADPKLNISKARVLLTKLEATYPSMESSKIRPELCNSYFGLGGKLLSMSRPTEAIEMMAKGFQALDYDITASSRQLHIKQWGAIKWWSGPWGILLLAYMQVAPQLCKAVKKYAEIEYSTAVGESETFLDMFPQFAHLD